MHVSEPLNLALSRPPFSLSAGLMVGVTPDLPPPVRLFSPEESVFTGSAFGYDRSSKPTLRTRVPPLRRGFSFRRASPGAATASHHGSPLPGSHMAPAAQARALQARGLAQRALKVSCARRQAREIIQSDTDSPAQETPPLVPCNAEHDYSESSCSAFSACGAVFSPVFFTVAVTGDGGKAQARLADQCSASRGMRSHVRMNRFDSIPWRCSRQVQIRCTSGPNYAKAQHLLVGLAVSGVTFGLQNHDL